MILALVLFAASLASHLGYNSTPDTIPSFVIANAPHVYLFSEEKYMPGNIAEYVQNFWMSNSTTNFSTALTISNLNSVANSARQSSSSDLFLSARIEWKDQPWISNLGAIPRPWDGMVECCPVTLIVVDKGDFIDAFWFYFYPFNEGPYVMGQGPMGNHLADWEHSLVRFDKHGKPILLWMSQHGGGAAYHWDALPKLHDQRPFIYSGRGTHANYVSQGQHSHDIPWHWLSDYTDRGYLWDPTKNYLAYTFDGSTVRPANGSHDGRELEYKDWLLFDGHWGDKKLPSSDPRQHWAVFNWQMIDGPQGPLFKNLMRNKPCERHKWWNIKSSCRVRKAINYGDGIESDRYECPAFINYLPTKLQYFVHGLCANSWLCYFYSVLKANGESS